MRNSPKGRRPKPSAMAAWSRKPDEGTEPHVQRLFIGSYRETGMEPQGLAGVGFCASTPVLLARHIFMNISHRLSTNDYGKLALAGILAAGVTSQLTLPVWGQMLADVLGLIGIVCGAIWIYRKFFART